MSKFQVIEKLWHSAKFTVNIVRLPDDVVDDKLAILSDGTGTLSFFKYEQFLLNNCVVDVEKVLKFLESLQESSEKMLESVVELKDLIVEVNPLLNPELLIINNENIIKIPEQDDKPEEVRRLVDNPDWDKPGFTGPTDDDIESFIRSLPPPIIPAYGNGTGGPGTVKSHKWEELDMLLVVVGYEVDDIPEIFSDTTVFEGEEDYKKYIVTKCIYDFQSLFILLDRMGYAEEHGAENLTQQLYDISVTYNPFLAWEEIDLDKVKKAVDSRMKHKKPVRNKFKKTKEGEEEDQENAVKEFDELTEEEVLTLPNRMKKFVVGQDEVIDVVCESVWLAKCGLKEPDVPIGVYMFTGETGCGKTHCSKMLAQELYGDEYNIVRVDCSEYSQKHEISKLIGSPSGYVGYEDGGYLTNALLKNSSTVVLFDEIEKAHSRLYDLLLQIMDEGRLTSNKGETVSFGSSVIVMTSNIGVKEVKNVKDRIGFGDVSILTKDKHSKAVKEAINKKFKPEFINRVDGILTFNTLAKESCLKIIDLAFAQINMWFSSKNNYVKYDDNVREHIYKVGFSPGFGARPLKRALKKHVLLPLSKTLLNKSLSENVFIDLSIKNDEIKFDIKEGKDL
jgi:ATP-dependent Clp protease ATP-binding subunit ClpC